ncbi:hypothetical protein [Streptomyces xanthii]|uniref:Ankyrin n=1 Tax=Streptomyces xanthii TaxID=2768069 RepID=A0A7H1B2E2_9ACTN|nr:hypothetical protein [Streptomyces xanthii]QNS02897.1 hypothetical protein IAG42_04150 [Streptomyces xanthii]
MITQHGPARHEGDLEAHLTVDAGDESAVGRLADWAAAHGLGFTHIVLARGHHPSQPMVTLRGHGRADAWLRTTVAETAAALAHAGFPVLRTKAETTPWASGVPQTDAEARLAPSHLHFEHHVKLLLPAEADLDALAARVVTHGAHLSRNARRIRPDGMQERFVTQRCHAVGASTAHRRLEALLAELPDAQVAETEREYVFHDTHLDLDAGWLTGTPEVAHAVRTSGARGTARQATTGRPPATKRPNPSAHDTPAPERSPA